MSQGFKSTKKFISVLLACILFTCSFSFSSFAEQYVKITENTDAVVIEVVDGDAIMVRLANNTVALVRLIGVNTMGNNEAFNYLNAELMGSTVYLVYDGLYDSEGDRFSKMYVYKGTKLINVELLINGLGKVNADDASSSLYASFLKNESFAKTAKLGLWNDGYVSGIHVVGGDRVNINTASREILKSLLNVSSYSLADNIISYRDKHPFEIIGEVKFVKGMTKEIYDQIRNRISVITNINTASEKELRSLKGFSDTAVAQIIAYRGKYNFSQTKDLYTGNAFISLGTYNSNKYFMSVKDESYITYAQPDYTVNINTATNNQLINAGLTQNQADKVINARNKYKFKSLYDLSAISGMGFTPSTMNEMADNLHIFTNINTATQYELRSILGNGFSQDTLDKILINRPYSNVELLKYYISSDVYNNISAHLYVDTPDKVYFNINTATSTQLNSYGFNPIQVIEIEKVRGKMLKPDDIPLNIRESSARISIYTNINNASVQELESLPGMDTQLINEIIAYRQEQPFGSLDEIKLFLTKQDKQSTYEACEKFLVIR